MLLTAERLSKNYGGKQLFQDVSLYLNAGDKVGLIGVNGTGKSTLLKILASQEEPDSGFVRRQSGARMAYLPQIPCLNEDLTVLEQVFESCPAEFRSLNEYEAKTILNRLGIEDFDRKIGTLSGGQRKRVALASVFVRPADILILDEPTNHLDSDMVLWLEQQLSRFTGCLLMVTHDRFFLDRVTGRIAELSHAKLYTYEGGYSRYLEGKAERLEREQASERKRQALLRRESAWIARGCRARTTKSTERIGRYEALKAQEAPQQDASVSVAAQSSRLGRKTIELKNVGKVYGERTIIRDFSYTVLRDDRVGIVGKNGAGKSTLLNLIGGVLAPDAGTVDMGGTVKVGYFTQEGKELDPKQRPWDYIHEIASTVKTEEGTLSASQMMERFLFTADMQFSAIGKLSGGERRRLYLLGILMSAPNILMLDEPTNDLDIETLTILEDYLDSFPGAVIAVSHDRFFLDKVAQSIWEVPGNGDVNRFVGNFEDYLAQRRREEKPSEAPSRSEAPKERPAHNRKLRFSYKEQREYDTIEDDIALLEEQIALCDKKIMENASDYGKLVELEAQKQELSERLDEKMERWVTLNELAEKIRRQE